MRLSQLIWIFLALTALISGCGRHPSKRLAELSPTATPSDSDEGGDDGEEAGESEAEGDGEAESEGEAEAEEESEGTDSEEESADPEAESGEVPTEREIPRAETYLISGNFAPIETLFVDISEIPLRLASKSLRFKLRSNVEGARFECRWSGRGAWLQECFHGDEFVVNGLSDRNVYRLELRAVSPAGVPDATPMRFSFLVDLRFGMPLVPRTGATGAADLVPQSPADLPGFRATPAKPSQVSSAVALGRYLAFVVPYGHRVGAYATDLTYNGRLKLFLAMDPASLIDAPSCNRTWERLVDGPDGTKFCDATPRAVDLPASYRRPIPRNHIETFSGPPGNPDEKLYVAAFNDQPSDPDEAEARLDLNAYCPKEARRGSIPAALLTQKLGGHLRDQLHWCMIQGTDSSWWWIGHFKLNLTQDRGRLAAVYAVRAATLSLQNSQEFVRRTIDVMSKVLVPLGVSP